MGRRARRVPHDWSHPRDQRQQYIPLRSSAEYARHLELWEQDAALGEDPGDQPDEKILCPGSQHLSVRTGRCTRKLQRALPFRPSSTLQNSLRGGLPDSNANAFAGSTAPYEDWLGLILGTRQPSSGIFTSAVPRAGFAQNSSQHIRTSGAQRSYSGSAEP